MARGFVPIKGGGAPVKPKNTPEAPKWVLGSRPAVLRSPPIGRRSSIVPQGAGTRQYGKQADPFSTLGQSNTGMTGET